MKPKQILEAASGLLAAAALFSIKALTFLDVIGRKAFDHSIPGSLELTELLMVVVIFAALPLVSERGEHVVFDSMDAYLPAWALRAQSAVIDAISGVVLLLLAWLMWRTGNDFVKTGETTAQLLILKAPFIYGMAAMAAITGLIHFWLIAHPARQPGEGEGVAL
jgi:TRAP-type C4-dicarboxylate transport system permease small subunit